VAVSALGVSVFGGLEDIASARVWFEDGVIADLSASRVSMHAVRTMRMWGSEGYVALDFGGKNGTIVKPSDNLRRGEIDLEGVDRSDAKAVKAHLFSKVLRVDRVQGEGPEPLQPELEEFVRAVTEGIAPQVSGHEALRAMALADQILQSIEAHPWEGLADGPVGPRHLPEPLGEPAGGIPEPKFLRYARSPREVKDVVSGENRG
jgi:predicted dehydrogenase